MFNLRLWSREKEKTEVNEGSTKEQNWTLIDVLEEIIDITKH